jgi:hypothetical protein
MRELTEFGRPEPLSVNALMPWLALVGVALTLAIATVWELGAEHRQIAQSTADAKLSAIVGPACPQVSAAAFQSAVAAQGRGLRYVFDFNGDSFSRSFGDGDCGVAAANGSLGLGTYDVCEFTSPGVLAVKTSRGQFYFLPGLGQKATVMTPNGIARCVMAAPKLDG